MQKFNYHTHTRRCGHADNNMSDEDFVKEHPEYKELSSNEIHIKKKEEQARQYVAAAAMQIYAENEKRNKGVAQNNNNNQTYIYMPRQMQG